MAPGYWATIEPPPEVTNASEAKEEEDLNSNKEVLGPLLDKNSNRRQAAEQEHKDNKYSNEEHNGSQSPVTAEYKDEENKD